MSACLADRPAPACLPDVTVVIVSDERRVDRSWEEFTAIAAFAAQDYTGAVDILLVESDRHRSGFPVDWLQRFPQLAVHFLNADSAPALKNLGVAHAHSDLVAVFEADCVPRPDCLSRPVATLLAHPEVSAVSARTVYRGAEHSALRRCFSFMGRGRLELARLGEVPFISNNAQLMRADVARRFPLPELASPFVSAECRHAALRLAGQRFMFEPAAVNVHEFDGIEFELEHRRQRGFQLMERQHSKSLLKVLPLLGRTWLQLLAHVLGRGRRELSPPDLPLALALGFVLPICEIGGMIDAVRGRPTSGRRFR